MAKPALAAETVQRSFRQPRLRVLERVETSPPVEPPSRRLELPPCNFVATRALERELRVSHVVAQVLVRRGLGDPSAARAFIEAGERHPPGAFGGMDQVVNTIAAHVRDRHKFTVHGDYDVDGICATAILVRALRAIGADADWFIPSRLDDGYGLGLATVKQLATRGTELLITGDCAVTAIEEVAAAGELGIEVIVTDHHSPPADGELPDCAILHPAVCGYPCPDLCGAAVAYKLAEALDAPGLADDAELVALATVADLVPLRGENRRLVREGLRALADTRRPGLRALMASSHSDPSAVSTALLGFRLAPRLNAAGRLRRADAAVELLLTDDWGRAEQVAEELEQLNAERRAVEERIRWEAEAQVASLGDRSAYVLAGEDWHPGVIGIVASRIVERYHRPAILIALGDRTGTGSGRSIPGFDLLAALHATAQHLDRYGGHRAAAGLTLSRLRVQEFARDLEEYAQRTLAPEMLVPVERIDAVVSGAQVGLALAEELELLEPTGIGNPAPRLLIPGARLRDLRPMGDGNRHARFAIVSGGARAPAVAFGCEGRLKAFHERPVDLSLRLERNCWRGVVEPRLVLRHAQPCGSSDIVVLGEDDYLVGVVAECGRPLELATFAEPEQREGRTVLDRRGESPLAVLADVVASGEEVLAVCSDVERRVSGLRDRTGGFSLACWQALEHDPSLAAGFAHLVALDPPGCPIQAGLLERGSGFCHLAWGEAELRFAQQMHELEYGLRASLVSLYRELRRRGRVAGGELEAVLRGDPPPGRSARLAGRVTRVLAELRLITLDEPCSAVTVTVAAPTQLERSPAFRIYARRHEEGRLFLSSAGLRPSG